MVRVAHRWADCTASEMGEPTYTRQPRLARTASRPTPRGPYVRPIPHGRTGPVRRVAGLIRCRTPDAASAETRALGPGEPAWSFRLSGCGARHLEPGIARPKGDRLGEFSWPRTSGISHEAMYTGRLVIQAPRSGERGRHQDHEPVQRRERVCRRDSAADLNPPARERTSRGRGLGARRSAWQLAAPLPSWPGNHRSAGGKHITRRRTHAGGMVGHT